MKLFAIGLLAVSTIASTATAGSGSMDGQHRFVVNGRTHSLTCNAHTVDASTKNERFSCEYTNRTADNGPNQSMFVGEVFVRPRGNLFVMTQFGDSSDYVNVYTGRTTGAGFAGTGLDIMGNQYTFTIN